MLRSRRRYHIAADSARKRQKAESHARILASARTLFVKRGYDATTARDIAERAGLSVGTLFLHFKSKADILKTIIWVNNEAQYDLMRRLVPTHAPVKERLLRMAEIGYEREAAQSPLVAVVQSYQWLWDAETEREYRVTIEPITEMIRQILEDGIRSGEIRSDADLETTIECLIASHVWNFRAALFAGADVATLTERAGRTIDVLIDGLRPRNGTPAAGPTPA
jgi:TetR/AcrR family transcriptional regulator, cholesterol catabolism regulator